SSCPPSNRSVACTPLTRGSLRKITHWPGSRPTRTSAPGRIMNCPSEPLRLAAPIPDGAGGAYGGAGGEGWAFIGPVAGTAFMALVTGNPGAPAPPPPFVISPGIGCPHEKQTEVCPGVAMVIIPHDGHGIWTMGGGPAPESAGDNGVAPGGGC